MVVELLTLLLTHLILTFVGILMGKYIPNFVDKKDEKDVIAFIYWCIIPLTNIMVILAGMACLTDTKIRKSFKYLIHKLSKYLMK